MLNLLSSLIFSLPQSHLQSQYTSFLLLVAGAITVNLPNLCPILFILILIILPYLDTIVTHGSLNISIKEYPNGSNIFLTLLLISASKKL